MIGIKTGSEKKCDPSIASTINLKRLPLERALTKWFVVKGANGLKPFSFLGEAVLLPHSSQ
jgi:hypothetical protein